jgi:hypothetical protein
MLNTLNEPLANMLAPPKPGNPQVFALVYGHYKLWLIADVVALNDGFLHFSTGLNVMGILMMFPFLRILLMGVEDQRTSF